MAFGLIATGCKIGGVNCDTQTRVLLVVPQHQQSIYLSSRQKYEMQSRVTLLSTLSLCGNKGCFCPVRFVTLINSSIQHSILYDSSITIPYWSHSSDSYPNFCCSSSSASSTSPPPWESLPLPNPSHAHCLLPRSTPSSCRCHWLFSQDNDPSEPYSFGENMYTLCRNHGHGPG